MTENTKYWVSVSTGAAVGMVPAVMMPVQNGHMVVDVMFAVTVVSIGVAAITRKVLS
jgi:hypothetical protein